jgi:SAM-dependent methyltransferase
VTPTPPHPQPPPPTPEPDPEPEEGPPCPACGRGRPTVLFHATDRLYGTTSKDFTVVQCRGCGLMRLEPQPEPAELSRYYPRSYWYAPGEHAAERLEEAYRRLVLRDHVRFVERAIEDAGESGPVVDVGCGGGLFLRMLAERGRQVIGVDLSPEAARVAWAVNGVPTVAGRFVDTPLPPESCAVITMFHLLEHLYDPAGYLDAAHRALKPGGRLVVQVPNASSWQFLLFGNRWNGVDVPRHLFHFRRTDVEILLRDCGFEPVRWKYFSLRDNPAGLATTIAPSLDPMARRVRGVAETPRARLWKDMLYAALVGACIPFTLVEAACRAGSTVMVEARKKA